MARSHLRVALLTVLLLPITGCSFILVDGPPDVSDYSQLDYFGCTEGNGWPIVDGVFTGLYAVQAATLMGVEGGGGLAAASLVWAGVFGASAVTGFGRVNECKAAKAEWGRATRRAPGNLELDTELLPILQPTPPLPADPGRR